MATTQSLLTRVRTRLAAVAAIEDLQRGAAYGSGTALAVLLAERLGALPAEPLWAAYAGAGVALLVPAAGFVLRWTDVHAVAAAADERLGLRERVSTAIWCSGDERAAGEPLAALVVADAEAAAARVVSADISRAFRPRLHRRPLAIAGALVLACAGLTLWQPVAEAVETRDQKVARLADERRVAEVARKLEQQAKKVADAAEARKEETLARIANEIRRAASEMQKQPPSQEATLSKLNQMADRAKAEARKSAGMKEVAGTPEANEADRQLEQLLKDLADANLESLAKDLADLEKRLAAGDKGGPKPSAADMRAMAARIDAMRRALERAKEAGAEGLEKKLRNLGNEDLLEKIAERMRELASRMEQGQNYESLSDGSEGEAMDLSELSREELEQLLKDLEEMASMGELGEALRKGGAEARGGRKLRFRPGGSGT